MKISIAVKSVFVSSLDATMLHIVYCMYCGCYYMDYYISNPNVRASKFYTPSHWNSPHQQGVSFVLQKDSK